MAIVEALQLKVEIDGDRVAIRRLDRILKAQEGFEDSTERTIQSQQRFGEAIETTGKKSREFNSIFGKTMPQSLKTLRKDLIRSGEAAERAGSQLQRTSRGARGVAIDLGRIAADSPFGILGISNNVEQLFGSLGRARAELGSFGAVARSLLTPGALLSIGAGVVSGLAVAFGDDLLNAIRGSNDELKAFEGLIRDVVDFGDPTQQIDTLTSRLERFRAISERLGDERERLDEQDSTGVGRTLTGAQAGFGDFLESQGISPAFRRQLGLETQEDVQQLQTLDERKERIEAIREEIEKEVTALQARIELLKLTREFSLPTTDEGGQAAAPAPDSEFLFPGQSRQGSAAGAAGPPPETSFGELEKNLDLLIKVNGQIGRLQLLNEQGLLPDQELLRQKTQLLNAAYQQALRSNELTNEELAALREALNEARELSGTSGQAGAQFAEGIAQSTIGASLQPLYDDIESGVKRAFIEALTSAAVQQLVSVIFTGGGGGGIFGAIFGGGGKSAVSTSVAGIPAGMSGSQAASLSRPASLSRSKRAPVEGSTSSASSAALGEIARTVAREIARRPNLIQIGSRESRRIAETADEYTQRKNPRLP